MQGKTGAEGKAYEIVESNNPQFYLYELNRERPVVRVVSLTAASFTGKA